jgi:hypothetical protein
MIRAGDCSKLTTTSSTVLEQDLVVPDPGEKDNLSATWVSDPSE